MLCAGFAQIGQRVFAVVRASYEDDIARDLGTDKKMPNWLHPKAFGTFVEALVLIYIVMVGVVEEVFGLDKLEQQVKFALEAFAGITAMIEQWVYH